MLTTFDDWVQWKERCSIELCDVDTRDRLERFVQAQFRKQARRLAGFRPDLAGRLRELTDDTQAARRFCAHLFDSYMTPTGKDGKRRPYKDAMMSVRPTEAKDPSNPTKAEQAAAWAGYAAMCVRTIFDEITRKEIEGRNEKDPPENIDAPTEGTDGDAGSTPSDKLAGRGLSPSQQTKINDIYRVVDAIALDDRERLVLWADAHNVNRTGEEMTYLAGVAKTQISAAARKLEEKIVIKVAAHGALETPKRDEPPKVFQHMLEPCWDRLVVKHRNLVPEKQADGTLLWLETTSPRLAPAFRPA